MGSFELDENYMRLKHYFDIGVFNDGKKLYINKDADQMTPQETFIVFYDDTEERQLLVRNINRLDYEFFKSLIVNNKEATRSNAYNAFVYMPKDFITNEMVTVALFNAKNFDQGAYIKTIVERDPDSINELMFRLAGRLYITFGDTSILDVVPEEYKDRDFYEGICKSGFKDGIESNEVKMYAMNIVPQDMIDTKFVTDLIKDDPANIASFNEKGFATKISYFDEREVVVFDEVWKYIMLHHAELTKYIPLNEERVNYFIEHYDKDSPEYINGFKEVYQDYCRTPEDRIRIERNEFVDSATAICSHFLYKGAKNEYKASYEDQMKKKGIVWLPKLYDGKVPDKFSKKLDSEEYLKHYYEDNGIEILEEYNKSYYSVKLPEGMTIKDAGDDEYEVYNSEGEKILSYSSSFSLKGVSVSNVSLYRKLTKQKEYELKK